MLRYRRSKPTIVEEFMRPPARICGPTLENLMKTLFLVLAVAALSIPAHAQVKSFLVSQWFEKGNQMCKYDNGTVLNMGAKLCPLSI